MNRFGLLGTSALCSAAFFGSLAIATPAYAQNDTDCSALPTQAERDACTAGNTAPAEPNGQPAAEGGNITVTGSRIARPTLESPVPVTSVSSADLLSQGTINIGDALNDLPQLRSTFSQANSTRFIGTSGLNILDLRGLGVSRTLVLVNGRRHITASPGDYLVDTNTIPDDLLERVDIVTGGSSAIYGSDAVAGVVNFVLKRDFDGIRVSGQGGISEQGDRGSYFGAVTIGRNFADGRGNIAVAAEYSKANALYNVDRPKMTGAFTGRRQFNLSDDPTNEPAAGDGVPDQTFFVGVRNGTISDGGMITAVCNTAVIADLNRCRPSSVATTGPFFGQRYMFDQTGRLVLSNPSLDFRDITNGGSSNTIGGLGSTLNNTGQLEPKLERFSVNLLAHYDISEAFSPYIEAKFVRIKANQEGQPSFFQTGLLATYRCNNPFLRPESLQTLQGIGQCVNPATSTFLLSRFNVDFGGRGELHTRDTYRIVGGVQGTFNDDWKYDISVNYGRLKTKLDSLNNLLLTDINGNFDGYLLAYDAVRNAAGDIVCRVNQVTVTRPDCVPLNPFGYGAPSQAALDFVNTTAHRDERATEFDVLATLAGDSSGFFELPGGPIRFSVGAEYRKETARSVFDPLTAAGGTFLNAIAPFLPPNLTIKEAFAEVELPILKDLPFADELTLNGAVRVSDYNTAAGTVWTYNGGVYYAPIHDLRFRGNYARSVRAPTQSDLYASASQNFANGLQDPCDTLFIGAGTNRAANCTAAGIPAGFVNTPARSSGTSFLQGGNPFLVSEVSDSYTAGLIFEPRWVRGMSITVDYYRIHVKNLIAALTAQTIINSCYDSPSGINNGFCAVVFRDPTTHFFQQPVATIAGPVNFQRQETKGVDVDLAWNRTLGNGDRIGLRGIFSYVIQRTNFIDPANPLNPNRQLSELGDPQLEFQLSANYRTGPLSLRYQFQFIGKQNTTTYEAQHSYPGVCPNVPINGCTPGSITLLPPLNADSVSPINYPSIIYHNARIGWNIDKKFEFYFGVDNITNRLPPFGSLGVGAGSSIWDNVGRYFYSGFKANF